MPSPLAAELRRRKPAQVARFHALRREFAARYEACRNDDWPGAVEPEWDERNRALELEALPEPSLEFIRHPSVLYSMFVPERYLARELPTVLGALDGDALDEDPVGGPPLVRRGGRITSSNTVHHLFHLRRFAEAGGTESPAIGTVVEWGGGYGNMAKLFLRLHGGAPTYVLVDTPLFACLQWLYLSAVLGPERVALQRDAGRPVAPGRVTVVPVRLAPELAVDADLFVSTWALNESPQALQDLVVERRWFGAERLLLGMHDGVPLAGRAARDGARIVPIGDFMPGQNYVLR